MKEHTFVFRKHSAPTSGLGRWAKAFSLPQDGCCRGHVDASPLLAEDTPVPATAIPCPSPPEDSERLGFSSCSSTWPCPSATRQPTQGQLGKGTPLAQRESGQRVAGVHPHAGSRCRLAVASPGGSPLKFCSHGAWRGPGHISFLAE